RIIERVMFLPHLCAGIAVALIFQWLFDEEGSVNAILSLLSLPTFRWLNSSSTAMICVVIVSIWKSMGYYALIIMSSLKSIPSEINEAADLDDAGSIRRFFRITLPMLSPQLFFLFITITIGSFKVFESVRILTGGGPGDSTDVLVFWIYRKAFSGTVNVGLASAAGVILMIILAIFTVFYYLSMGKKVHYQ
ncbi:MAG: sugar ABC transporter permease, partial [Spirochaetales bacterium]|nr:sugar ABC transporter permease [Spirochaetales bacterium]